MVYAIHIPGSDIFKFCKLSKKQSMLDELEVQVHSMAFQDNHSIALKRHDLLSDRIYKVCSRYIPCIYYAYTMQWSLASPLSCQSALGSLRPGLPSELLSFCHREAAHERLGPSKVPQPGVHLVQVAFPSRKHGMSGTRPRRSSILPTLRVGTGEGSYTL